MVAGFKLPPRRILMLLVLLATRSQAYSVSTVEELRTKLNGFSGSLLDLELLSGTVFNLGDLQASIAGSCQCHTTAGNTAGSTAR